MRDLHPTRRVYSAILWLRKCGIRVWRKDKDHIVGGIICVSQELCREARKLGWRG